MYTLFSPRINGARSEINGGGEQLFYAKEKRGSWINGEGFVIIFYTGNANVTPKTNT